MPTIRVIGKDRLGYSGIQSYSVVVQWYTIIQCSGTVVYNHTV